MESNDTKSIIHLVIQIIICLLLAAIFAVGVILVHRGSKDKVDAASEVTAVETEKQGKIEEKNEDKDNPVEKTSDIEPSKETTNSNSSTNGLLVGDEYYADVYDYLSIRSEASPSAKCMLELEPGTRMVILRNESNDMVHVKTISNKYSGSIGYVNKNYITKCGEAAKRNSYDNNTYYVSGTQEYLPLRSIAEVDDRYIISRLYNGDKVILLEVINSKFWRVRDVKNNVDGYVVAGYLRR